jgi:DNA-binding GntR family transcriptional regulator
MPGELLQIGMLARELGTSTTPVREALARLAAERLIAYTPKKGFLVKAISEEELRGLYIVNQMHLQTALRYSSERASGRSAEISSDSTRLSTKSGDRAADVAFTTANLFLGIAASAGIEEIVAMVDNINSRLHRPRIAEHVVIDDMAQEISTIIEQFAAGQRGALREALERYHKLRLQMLPLICKELLSMGFAKR